ncbi:MAG: hypothetical protein MUF00_03245 [Gemmatimonadaceae bacterium]|jgi:hypothetical protein|nr:hypothetical protein [Gemmatimonadaceae bacterium]
MTLQTWLALAVVAVAGAVIARRVWRTVRGLRAATQQTAACGDGCGCAAPTSATTSSTLEWDEVAPSTTRARAPR